MKKLNITEGKSGTAITVQVVPRTSKNEIISVNSDGNLKVKLTSPSVEEKANKELTKFLSNLFGIQKSQIEIIAGEKSKLKLVGLIGISPDNVNVLVNNYLSMKK